MWWLAALVVLNLPACSSSGTPLYSGTAVVAEQHRTCLHPNPEREQRLLMGVLSFHNASPATQRLVLTGVEVAAPATVDRVAVVVPALGDAVISAAMLQSFEIDLITGSSQAAAVPPGAVAIAYVVLDLGPANTAAVERIDFELDGKAFRLPGAAAVSIGDQCAR